MMLNMSLTTPFAVYVHWPFCLSKCPSCDFNSHARHGGINESCFLGAEETATHGGAERRRCLRACETESPATPARLPHPTESSIFFGAGTPSLMQPSSAQAI